MTENVWCAVNTLSLSCFCLLSLLLSPFSFSLHPPLSCNSYSLLLHYSNLYTQKKSLPVFITCVEMQSRNINIWVKNRNITTMMLRWRLTLTANICIFWFSLIFFSFFIWLVRDFLSSVSQYVTVSVNIFTVFVSLSAQESMNRIPNLYFDFDVQVFNNVYVLSSFFRWWMEFLPALSALCS